MKTQRHIVAGLLLGFVLLAGAQTASAQVDLFNNTNGDGVRNNPISAPRFTITVPTMITQVMTYHWNSGLGATPGFISISSRNGQLIGRFQARGTAGQNGVPNINWIATPNLVLPAGQYNVLDSNISTWSNNARSGFVGFGIVRGSVVATPGPGTPPPSADLGSNNPNTPTVLIPVASMPNVGAGLLQQIVTDGIGGSDTNDWYSITVAGPNGSQRPRTVFFSLTGFAGIVSLTVESEDYITQPFSPFRIPPRTQIATTAGPSPRSIPGASLLPGRYLLHVSRTGTPTTYSLTITTPAL